MATIRRALRQDRNILSELHREEIPWGLLSRLGPEFVDAFYAALLGSAVGFAFVAEHDGRPVGFASGVTNWRGLYRDFLFNHGRMALRGLWMSLRRASWRKLLETSRYATGGELPAAELVAIAVTTEMRGTGVAAELVAQVLKEFEARGVRAVRVTTSADNDRAGHLYERTGFRLLAHREIHPGQAARIYVAALNPREGIRTPDLDQAGG